jgi:hypothetical protein
VATTREGERPGVAKRRLAVWRRHFGDDESHPSPRRSARRDSHAPAADLPAAVRPQEARRFAGHATQDAVEVLRDAGAMLFAASNFWWLDARWRAIRQR